MTQTPRPAPVRRRRRWLWFAPFFIALPLLAIVSLPWMLSTLPGRDYLLGRANRTLTPGNLRIDTLRFSWFGPTRMHWFVLRSAQGRQVVAAEHATWDRNLFQLLFDRPNLGTLRLDHPLIEIERTADGKIDLYETLRPVIGLDPETSAKIDVVDGQVRIRGAGLAEPVVAEHADVNLTITPKFGPISWEVRLANGDPAQPRNTLRIDGQLDPKLEPGDLKIQAEAKDWPIALQVKEGRVSGRLGGLISGSRTKGRWIVSGDAALGRVEASGLSVNQGRTVEIERVRAAWELDLAMRTALIRSFDLTTALGTLNASGKVASGKVKLSGEAKLAVGTEGLQGGWSAEGSLGREKGGVQVDGTLLLQKHKDGTTEGRPVTIRVLGSAPEGFGRVDLTALDLETEFGRANLSGRVEDPTGKRVVDLKGTIAPEWKTVNDWLVKNVEPGAKVSGRETTFHATGPVDAMNGEIGVNMGGADVYGMNVGPVALVLRSKAGKVTVDPIETTVNGGRLHVEPEIRPASDAGPAAIVLGGTTSLTGAAVNDEVSRRVLSYVAPVLDQATRVRGQVSATIKEATFPIQKGSGPTVDGSVVFQDVEFMPAPWLDSLFAVVGREDRPLLKLNDPVALVIADRRVRQRGLTVPIGNLSKVEIEGSVGFDRSLDLQASVPVLPTMLADRPILGALAADARVRVPIRGTLQNPQIDREAFQAGMKEMARTLAERGGVMGAAGLLERLIGPRDPNAPPAPTAEERRERRQERRMDRQMRRGRLPEE